MTIGRICSRETHLADPEENVSEAAERMLVQNVGTLVVLDDEGRPTGIVTDRDLALRVLAPGLHPQGTKVEDVMTHIPRTVSEECPIEDALATMRGLGVRRMPVVDGERRLVGMISADDLLELLAEELGELGQLLAISHPGTSVPITRTTPAASAPALGRMGRGARPDLESARPARGPGTVPSPTAGEERRPMTNPVLDDLKEELEGWRTKLEHLRVQANLGGKELRDKLSEIEERLEPAHRRARERLAEMVKDGKQEASTLARSLQAGWDEVRETHRKLSDRSKPEGE